MVGQTHEEQCKICNILSPEDIQILEGEARDRKDNYTIIGARYGIKYSSKITKQQVSNHMKWLREKKISPMRDELLEKEKEKLLDTLEEHHRVHTWLWEKIEGLELLKAGATPTRMIQVHNTQDRFIKSILKGLRLLAELRGDAERDTRKLDITVALKQLREEGGMEE